VLADTSISSSIVFDMSTRRSSRRTAALSVERKRAAKPSVRRGLESLTEGNEKYIAKMLSIDITNTADNTVKKIADALEDCMNMNNLSSEMLMARFFDTTVLSVYSEKVLNKSGKGSTATLAARISKEWTKDDFQSLNSSKRKREEDDDKSKSKDLEEGGDDDWRSPLFYWKGMLIHDVDKNKLKWSGSWASALAENGLPNEEEFSKTKKTNGFKLESVGELKSSLPSNKNVDISESALLEYLVGKSGNFKGRYSLDQRDGEGPRQFKDLSHHFAFNTSSDDGNGVLVAACGSTEFGHFVSAGYIHIKNDSTTELVLARRYIDEHDSRQDIVKKKDARLLLESTNVNVHDRTDLRFWRDLLPIKIE